jgi:hypothetical protein
LRSNSVPYGTELPWLNISLGLNAK